MKPLTTIGRVFILAMILLFPRHSFATDDAIIAVVNDEIITLKDLREYLNTIYLQLRSDGKSDEDIHKVMMDYEVNGINQLIDDKLLLDEANKKQMQVRPKLIDDRMDQIKKRYASEQEFLNSLAHEGLSLTDLRNKIADQLKIKYIVESQVRSKIHVNPQEVTDFYEKHFSEFRSAEKIDLNSIFIAYGDDQKKAAEKANQALSLLALKDGKNFDEIAKKFSDAPSIGLIEKGQMLPSLEKSIFKLKEGELSPLIETDSGIYIFLVRKGIPAKVSSLEEVKNDINDMLFQEKFHGRMKAWLEDLRKKAYVEIKS